MWKKAMVIKSKSDNYFDQIGICCGDLHRVLAEAAEDPKYIGLRCWPPPLRYQRTLQPGVPTFYSDVRCSAKRRWRGCVHSATPTNDNYKFLRKSMWAWEIYHACMQCKSAMVSQDIFGAYKCANELSRDMTSGTPSNENFIRFLCRPTWAWEIYYWCKSQLQQFLCMPVPGGAPLTKWIQLSMMIM